MQHSLFDSGLWGLDYKDLLDEEDPIDKLIFELAEKGELKVGIVEVRKDRWRFFKKFILNFLSYWR